MKTKSRAAERLTKTCSMRKDPSSEKCKTPAPIPERGLFLGGLAPSTNRVGWDDEPLADRRRADCRIWRGASRREILELDSEEFGKKKPYPRPDSLDHKHLGLERSHAKPIVEETRGRFKKKAGKGPSCIEESGTISPGSLRGENDSVT